MDLELARQQWADGERRVAEARSDARRHRALAAQVDRLTAALRGRVGQTFTLAELASAYDGADAWAQQLLLEADPDEPVPLESGTAVDAAFHRYATGAADYRP